MKMRKGEVRDVVAITMLFDETIRGVNSADYNSEQFEAWAGGSKNTSGWIKRITEQTFFLAEEEHQLIGFDSIAQTGFLDFLFAHKDHQRKEVATALLDAIEKKAVEQMNHEINEDGSITVESFFTKNGYELIEIVEKEHKGVLFENRFMRKAL